MGEQKLNLKIKMFKIFLFLIIAITLAYIFITFLPFMQKISTRHGQEQFRDKIKNMGIGGFFMLLGLQLSQIFVVVLPGEPLEIMAGMCYGTIGGTLFILLTVFISTCIIYYLVMKYKEKYLYNFFKQEKIKKILNSKWYKDAKKTELILIILFIIPGTPKDLFVYMGALLNMRPIRFILIATFVRLPSVISSTLVGSQILYENLKSAFIVYGITTLITIGFIIILKLFDKNKITEEAIKSIK